MPDGKPSIERTNSAGQSEFYSRNDADGTTVIQGVDGVKKIITTFTNAGPLDGRLRSITLVKNGVTTILQKCDYDEKGQLIRNYLQMTKPHEFTYKYNERGRPIEIDVDGKMWMTRQYDDQGKLVAKLFASGVRKTYQYVDGGIKETIFEKNGKTLVKQLTDKFAQVEESKDPITVNPK